MTTSCLGKILVFCPQLTLLWFLQSARNRIFLATYYSVQFPTPNLFQHGWWGSFNLNLFLVTPLPGVILSSKDLHRDKISGMHAQRGEKKWVNKTWSILALIKKKKKEDRKATLWILKVVLCGPNHENIWWCYMTPIFF